MKFSIALLLLLSISFCYRTEGRFFSEKMESRMRYYVNHPDVFDHDKALIEKFLKRQHYLRCMAEISWPTVCDKHLMPIENSSMLVSSNVRRKNSVFISKFSLLFFNKTFNIQNDVN